MRALRDNWLWVAGILVSVVITFFSYPPHGLGAFMFVGLVPVFVAMEFAATWKQAAFRAWLYVFLGNAAICSWVAYSVHSFAEVPVLVGYPAVLVLSIVEQGSWPVLAALRHLLHRKFGVRPFFWTPAALLFLDVCWPKFFPNTMGNVFYQIPWLCQVADVTGVWGLTALLAMTNELVAAVVIAVWARSRAASGRASTPSWSGRELAKHGVATFLMLCLAISYGNFRLIQMRSLMKNPVSSLHVALVQSNINAALQIRKAQPRTKELEKLELFKTMMRLTMRAAALESELIFWPETAYPDTYHGDSPRENRGLTNMLDGFVSTNRLNIVFGARDQIGDNRYNALFYVTPDPAKPNAVVRQVYHKTKLLELTEHVPLSDWFPSLATFVKSVGGTAFASGSGPTVFQGPKTSGLGVMICLEGLYPRFTRALAEAGATVLVNITNDAWFGDSMEPDLHLYLTAFRAIETRRPLVRATSTGYSAIVDIDGSLRFKSDLGFEEVLDDDLPQYAPIRTPFMVFGDTLIALCGLYAGGWLLWRFWRGRRGSVRS